MATYLQGVTDYIPQVQPWTPNFNFYQSVLERKQQKYDQGWNKVNTMYNSILNAPMMRAQNIELRDDFFNNIEGEIKQMANLDLSLEQNIGAASQVFKPFYENKNMMFDIGYTKKYSDEMQKSESFRNCLDKEKCGGKYWSGGVRLMQHRANEFVNASDEQALNVAAPRYVPHQNFMEQAQAAAKDLNLNIQYDHKEGGYMVTTKNGEAAKRPLMEFFMARFGDDPALQDFWNAKASLLRYENPEKAFNVYEMSMIESKAESPEQLKQMIEEKADRINYEDATVVAEQTKDKSKAEFLKILRGKSQVESKIANGGIIKGGSDDKAYRAILGREKESRAVNEYYTEIADRANNAVYIDEEGNRLSSSVIDGTVANAMMMRDMGLAANTIAYQDYKVTQKPDQFALIAYRNQFKVAAANKSRAFELRKLGYKNIFDAGASYRKILNDKNYINPLTGDPKWVPAEEQWEHGVIKGGGRGTGDPADVAALLQQQLTQGMDPLAPQANSGGGSGGSTRGGGGENYSSKSTKGGKGGDTKVRTRQNMSESGVPPDYTEEKAYRVFDKLIPKVLQGGLPPKAKEDFGDKDKNLGVVLGKEQGPDMRMQTTIDDKDDFTNMAFKAKTDEVISDIASIIDQKRKSARNIQDKAVNERLELIRNIAADGNDPNNAKAIQLLVNIGDNISGTRRETGGIYDSPFVKTILKKFDLWPSSSDNALSANPAYFKEMLDVDIEDIKAAGGGTRALFELMTNNPEGTRVRSYNSDKMIDRKNVNILSDEEYKNLANRSQDRSAWGMIDASIKKHGRGVYPADHPDLDFHEANINGIEPLTDKESEDIRKYEWYTSQPSFDNGLKDLGLNSSIPEIQNLSNQQLTINGLSEWDWDAANQMEKAFNKHMNNAFESYKKGEEAPGGTVYLGGNKPANKLARNIIRNNVWKAEGPGTNGPLGGLTPMNDIYVKAMEQGAQSWATFQGETTIGDWFGSFSETIPQLEETYAGGETLFDDKALQKMMLRSRMIEKPLPRHMSAFVGVQLKKWFNEEGGREQMSKSGLSWWDNTDITSDGDTEYWTNDVDISTVTTYDAEGKFAYTKQMWGMILQHPETNLKRRDKHHFQIENKELFGNGYAPYYSLDDIEVSRNYENILELVHDEAKNIRVDFMNQANYIGKEGENSNLVLPSQFMGDGKGNFSFASGSMTNIIIKAGDRSQAEAEVVPFLTEVAQQIDAPISNQFIQGDPKFLRYINTTFSDELSEWKETDEARPIIHVDIEPMYKDMNISRVTVELSAVDQKKLLKKIGTYDKDAQKWKYHTSLKQTYYIDGSESEIIRKTRPNAQNVLIGLSEGEPYVDDMYWDEFGGKMEYKRIGQSVYATRIEKIYDEDCKCMTERRWALDKIPLLGTDWNQAVAKHYDDIYNLPYYNAELMINEEMIHSLDYYRKESSKLGDNINSDEQK